MNKRGYRSKYLESVLCGILYICKQMNISQFYYTKIADRIVVLNLMNNLFNILCIGSLGKKQTPASSRVGDSGEGAGTYQHIHKEEWRRRRRRLCLESLLPRRYD